VCPAIGLLEWAVTQMLMITAAIGLTRRRRATG
jgi:hypothetical protein